MVKFLQIYVYVNVIDEDIFHTVRTKYMYFFWRCNLHAQILLHLFNIILDFIQRVP